MLPTGAVLLWIAALAGDGVIEDRVAGEGFPFIFGGQRVIASKPGEFSFPSRPHRSSFCRKPSHRSNSRYPPDCSVRKKRWGLKPMIFWNSFCVTSYLPAHMSETFQHNHIDTLLVNSGPKLLRRTGGCIGIGHFRRRGGRRWIRHGAKISSQGANGRGKEEQARNRFFNFIGQK